MLSLAMVFVLGILSAFAFHRAPEENGVSGENAADRALAFALRELTGRPADLAAIKSVGVRDAAPPQLLQALDALIAERPGVRQEFLLSALVGGLPPRSVTASVQHTSNLPPSSGQEIVHDALLARWGTLDGRSAMGYATTRLSPERREAGIEAVLRGWAKSAPEDAWAWAAGTEASAGVAAARLRAVLESGGARDLEAALRRVGTVEPPERQILLMREVTEWLVFEMGGERALPWLAVMDEDGLPLEIIDLFARRWAASDPGGAVAWAMELDPDSQSVVLPGILPLWVAEDPETAATWAYASPPGDVRADIVEIILTDWIRADGLGPPARWLTRQERHPDLDPSFERISAALMDVDPRMSIAWAQSIMDNTRRLAASAVISRRWLIADPVAALPVVSEVLPGDIFNSLLADPDLAARLLAAGIDLFDESDLGFAEVLEPAGEEEDLTGFPDRDEPFAEDEDEDDLFFDEDSVFQEEAP